MAHMGSRLDAYRTLHRALWAKGLSHAARPFVAYDVSIPAAGFVGPVAEASYSTFSYQVIDVGQLVENPTGDAVLERLACNLVPVRSKSILVRKVYLELAAELGALSLENGIIGEGSFSRGAVVSGHPGIGKSFFLSYLLVTRILEGKSTIFQPDEISNSYFRFDATGVNYIDVRANTSHGGIFFDPLDNDNSTWALCDGKPIPTLLDGSRDWFFVQASAIGEEHYGRWQLENSIPVYFMDVWSWEEMIAAIPIRDRGFDMIDKLHLCFVRYGPIPRICLNLLYPSADVARWRRTVNAYEARLRAKAKEMLLNAPLATTMGKAWDPSSHLFFTIRPYENPTHFSSPLYGDPTTVSFAMQWRATIETPYLARLIGTVADSLSVFTYARFLDTLLLEDYTRPAAQFLFEGLAHSRLSEGGKFTLQSLGFAAVERIEFRILAHRSHTFTTTKHLHDALHALYPPPPTVDSPAPLPPDEESLLHRYLHISSTAPDAPKGLVLIPCGGGLSPPCRVVIIRFAAWTVSQGTEARDVQRILQAIPPHLLDMRRYAPYLAHAMPPINRSRLGHAFEAKMIEMAGIEEWPKRAKQWSLCIEDRFTKWGGGQARAEGADRLD